MSRILVVDESAAIRASLRDILEEDGYDVSLAANGQDAMAQAAVSRPDVALLDIEMPEMDGIDVLLALKAKKETHGVSVIMLTSHDRDDKVVGALEVGATDFIPKPFSAAIVRARVRSVIRIRSRHRKVQAATEAKAQFLADMSHEIRTPMSAILGYADLLYSDGDITKAPKHRIAAIRTIKRNGEYLLDLINDILDLSKVEAGKLEVESIRCSPVEILTDVISMMQAKADAKSLPLQAEYIGPIPETIHTDPTRLRQILINLVSNAIKFTESGSVRVLAQLQDGDSDEAKMQYEVIDSGVGMTEEQLVNAFRPFCQAETYTTRKYGGTGLGLTISRRLAELLGGSINVTSAPANGSAFHVTVGVGSLEGVKLHLNLDGAVPEPEACERTETRRLDCRVLLAEDGPDNQRLISYVLTKAGAKVTTADNGQIAVDLALTAVADDEPYDVVLMDMQMPLMNGYDATMKLRAEGYAGPVIALTACAMSHDRQKCLDAGCDEYVSKPINHLKLLSQISRAVRESETGEGETQRRPVPEAPAGSTVT